MDLVYDFRISSQAPFSFLLPFHRLLFLQKVKIVLLIEKKDQQNCHNNTDNNIAVCHIKNRKINQTERNTGFKSDRDSHHLSDTVLSSDSATGVGIYRSQSDFLISTEIMKLTLRINDGLTKLKIKQVQVEELIPSYVSFNLLFSSCLFKTK